MSARPFRLLSLDGGGIRGAYAAAFLASVEEMSGKTLVDHFDLIVGTSTGGIIAAALGLGLSAKRVLDFYEQHGPAIFPSASRIDRILARMRRFPKPKFSAVGLEQALKQVFDGRLLGESRCRLAIPAYEVVSNRVQVFKTSHHERLWQDYKRPVVEVLLATAAAPTYLPAALTNRREVLVDGGIWANCPVMVGVAEALSLRVSLADIKVLSVGTLGEAKSFADAARKGGIFQYGLEITALLMDAQSRGALSQAELLLKDRLVRIDRVVGAGTYALDDPRDLPDLIALGNQDGRHRAREVVENFLDQPASPFVPFHACGAK